MVSRDQTSGFAAKLRLHRLRLGLTQYQIPGFSRVAIACYEAGLRMPLPSGLQRLARALGVRTDDLRDEVN